MLAYTKILMSKNAVMEEKVIAEYEKETKYSGDIGVNTVDTVKDHEVKNISMKEKAIAEREEKT